MIDRFPVDLCDPLQLDNVQAALSQFAFGYEGMRFTKPSGNLPLKKAGILTRFDQALQECLIGSLICRISFIHKSRLRDCPSIPQNREWLSQALHLLRARGESKKDRGAYESSLFGIPRN